MVQTMAGCSSNQESFYNLYSKNDYRINQWESRSAETYVDDNGYIHKLYWIMRVIQW